MSDPQSLMSRIGNWFKRSENGAASHDAGFDDAPGTQTLLGPGDLHKPTEPRSTFLRPWAKRDQAIDNLQNGISSLSHLMDGIRENLERSSQRQDELLKYLAHLPEALQQLPESSRLQTETLRAIHQGMAKQSQEQSKLADILERITQADAVHGRTLDALQDRVETLNETDGRIAENLHQFGAAMNSVSKNSESNALVLQQMRDNVNARDGELERILSKQSTRFTTMLAVAIFLSIAALAAVGVIGYLGWQALEKMK